MKHSLQQIAEAVGVRLIGDGRVEVSGVASIESASKDDLVFVEDEKHLNGALRSRAGAVIAGEFAASAAGHRPLLISDHPKLSFARAARVLAGGSVRQGGVHSTAVVHSSAELGAGVAVEEQAVVAEGARIGGGTRVGARNGIGLGLSIGIHWGVY